ncbi:hypothetical protein REPUB_Repub06bG0050800 [Reevesia pubescens]
MPSSSSLFLLQSLTVPSIPSLFSTLLFHQNPNYIPFKASLKIPFNSKELYLSKPQTIPFALTESDSPKSLESNPQTLLQEVADSFDLPSDYFSQLPGDLRIDPLEGGSRQWDSVVKGNCKSSGTRNKEIAQRPHPQLRLLPCQKIAKAMNAAGILLSASSISAITDEQPKMETRMFKFGELQVEVTSEKANIGAVICSVFGILSWQIAQGIQSIPESSLEYANDNALLLAKEENDMPRRLGYKAMLLTLPSFPLFRKLRFFNSWDLDGVIHYQDSSVCEEAIRLW